MKPLIKPTKKKTEAWYKTIYIKETLEKEIEKIATECNTSFNNVVISFLEYGVENYKETNKEENLVNN